MLTTEAIALKIEIINTQSDLAPTAAYQATTILVFARTFREKEEEAPAAAANICDTFVRT